MFESLRFRKRDVLEEPKRLSTADYLCRLMEEQNQLLRELLVASGHSPRALKANPAVNSRRVYTDKDVFRVTREETELRIRQEQDRIQHPWRGPVNPETSAKSTVTCRRSASSSGLRGGGDAAGVVPRPASAAPAPSEPRDVPHRGQKAKPGSQEKPHAAQSTGCRTPHRGQNAKPGDRLNPQPIQAIEVQCPTLREHRTALARYGRAINPQDRPI